MGSRSAALQDDLKVCYEFFIARHDQAIQVLEEMERTRECQGSAVLLVGCPSNEYKYNAPSRRSWIRALVQEQRLEYAAASLVDRRPHLTLERPIHSMGIKDTDAIPANAPGESSRPNRPDPSVQCAASRRIVPLEECSVRPLG
jgi:hypothetical protein